MSKINKILFIVLIILIIALAGVLYWQKGGFETPYWAVYLNTGDLYFGKLGYFPHLNLTDVWLLQRNSSNAQNPLSVVKFSQAFWGPEDKIYLNEKNVIWKAKLVEDSQIVQYIKNLKTSQNPSLTQPNQLTQPTTSTQPSR